MTHEIRLINNIKDKIAAFSELRLLYEDQLAIGFNSFNFHYFDENKVSDILAFLLDPKGNHCQADLYLKLFLNHFNIKYEYNNVKVIREKSTEEKKRIDIWISLDDNKNVIAIENKIYEDTRDQPNQVQNYLDYMDVIVRENYKLFYLAPQNKELSTNSISEDRRRIAESEDKLEIINYEENILPLLDEFRCHTKNDRVQNFIYEFKLKLEEKYLGITDLNENKMIKEFILKEDQNAESAFKIQNALDQLKKELKEEFKLQLQKLANELKIDFNPKFNHFILPNLKKHYVKVNYEQGGVIYGIVKSPNQFNENSNKYGIPKIEEKLNENFNTSQWWPLWAMLYDTIEKKEFFWIDINNGRAVEKIRKLIVDILEIDNIDEN